MILAGDIGGTKTNLALFYTQGSVLKTVAQHQFSNKDFSTLEDIFSAFQVQFSIEKITCLSLGLAGPVINNNCQITNLPWHISSEALKNYWQIDEVYLLNDLEATAYGMLYLQEDEFADLNPSGNRVEGNRAVLAAGTGLGEALLFFDGERYRPVASEGGHSDFAPLSEEQDDLLRWLRHRYPAHVSYERILSGPGISLLYDFLRERSDSAESDVLLQSAEGKDRSAMITDLALREGDPLCLDVLGLFAEIYGAEAGNLALKTMSLGGVYIGGGIAPKILCEMTKERFMRGFAAKGRFREMLQEMQVKISLNPETALLGAVHFALDT